MKTRTLASLVVAIVAAVTLSACSSEPSGPPAFDGTHVSASQFAAATQVDGVTVIDVRTPAEFAQGHIPGAINMDVQGPDFAQQVARLDPQGKYALYCHSGNRSRLAQDYFTQVGVTMTVGLDGGIGAWKGDIEKGA